MIEVVYIELIGAGNAKTGIKCDIHTTTFDELKKLIKIEFPVALANVDAPTLVIKDSLDYVFPISQTVDHAINRGLGESDASPILVEVPSLVHLAEASIAPIAQHLADAIIHAVQLLEITPTDTNVSSNSSKGGDGASSSNGAVEINGVPISVRIARKGSEKSSECVIA
eukprot:gene6132-6752_t